MRICLARRSVAPPLVRPDFALAKGGESGANLANAFSHRRCWRSTICRDERGRLRFCRRCDSNVARATFRKAIPKGPLATITALRCAS
jgi:hypothetical protein